MLLCLGFGLGGRRLVANGLACRVECLQRVGSPFVQSKLTRRVLCFSGRAAAAARIDLAGGDHSQAFVLTSQRKIKAHHLCSRRRAPCCLWPRKTPPTSLFDRSARFDDGDAYVRVCAQGVQPSIPPPSTTTGARARPKRDFTGRAKRVAATGGAGVAGPCAPPESQERRAAAASSGGGSEGGGCARSIDRASRVSGRMLPSAFDPQGFGGGDDHDQQPQYQQQGLGEGAAGLVGALDDASAWWATVSRGVFSSQCQSIHHRKGLCVGCASDSMKTGPHAPSIYIPT